MLDSLYALHARVVADLQDADGLGLVDVGIGLDMARIGLESAIAAQAKLQEACVIDAAGQPDQAPLAGQSTA
ncbi:hypothetical protein EAH87_11040 [Sphingomonas koreensis]|nr:hypothetical protein EAH87_11040 [Sphingomonas koreensis]